MTPIDADNRIELAHRSSDGIEVSLFWSKQTDRVSIEILDGRLDARLEFEVDRRKALDAFHHPYVYAPASALDGLNKTREPVHS